MRVATDPKLVREHAISRDGPSSVSRKKFSSIPVTQPLTQRARGVKNPACFPAEGIKNLAHPLL